MAARYDGKLTIRVIDDETKQPIVARMELRKANGRPVKVRAKGIASHGGYFVFDGEVVLELRKGTYQFLIEAGPEYQTRPGHFVIQRNSEDSTEIALRSRVNMREEGWWAGDLDMRQRWQDLPLLMRAARVNITSQFDSENIQGKCKPSRLYRKATLPKSGEHIVGPPYVLDHRRGGGLLFFNNLEDGGPINICDWKAEDSSLSALETAEEAEATIVSLTPFAWDFPLWVASGKLDAVQIIHRHALLDDVVDNEGWGRKRDRTFFPGKLGNGRWSEAIYQHLLNCGLQIPPAAGSGSGANNNPIGTNRVYVHCGDDFTQERWWSGLRAGQVLVTNGPLLRTKVAGELPGHQFQLAPGETREFQIGLNLAFYEKAPVDYLEVVKNGRVEYEIRLNELAKKRGKLPPLSFDSSGWFLVRAITSSTKNYQFATTGPYYVQANYEPRVSRASVKFFLDWLAAAEVEFAKNEVVLADIAAAKPFWEALLASANAD